MKERGKRKILQSSVLLRKSKTEGTVATVMSASDFPFRFIVDGNEYRTAVTRSGGIITTKIK
jgi:hypothetical protein